MADKSISELTAATQVGSTDLFVLEQSGVAKKLTGQILENWLVALADGHGGIQDIEKTSTSGLIDTYTITLADETVETFTVTNGKAISSVVKTGAVPPSLTDSYRINYNDGTHYDFTVTNGKGVTSIEKTSTSGLVDTYTITYNDSTTGTITVTNGKAITSITDKWAVSSSNTQTPSTWYNAAPELTPTNRYLWHYQVIAYNDSTSVDTTKAVVGVYGDTGDAWYMWIKYAANEPTQDSDMLSLPNKWIGIYSGTSSTAPVHYTSYDWYEYKGEKGDTGDAAEVTSTAIVYQASESGTIAPTGTWVDTVPTVVQGQFLWTRVTVNWNDGTSAVWYSVSYVAIDGQGSPGSQTPLVDSGNGVVGAATAYSRQDHQHPLNVPSSGEPAMDGTASRGNADTYSRSDHVHPTDTSRARVADMAAAYSQRTYAKGELCIYENVLYRCKDGIQTAEAWNSSHWETTNIGVELGDLNGAITSLGSDDIANDSTNVSGLKVTNALDTLNGAISAAEKIIVSNQDITDLNDASQVTNYFVASTSRLFRVRINCANRPYADIINTFGYLLVFYINDIHSFIEYYFSTSGLLVREYGVTTPDIFGNWRPVNSCAARPNLLDNWYFAGGGSQSGAGKFPINQRGLTTYPTVDTTTIDRWILRQGSLTIPSSNDCIKFTRIEQHIDDGLFNQLIGKLITFSILTANNKLYSYTSVASSGNWLATTPTGYSFVGWGHTVQITDSNAVGVVAVKVELGDTQTLAHKEGTSWVLNELPNYYDELAKCQKYLQVIDGAAADIGIGNAYEATTCAVNIYTTVDTRRSISITGSNPDGIVLATGNFGVDPKTSTSLGVFAPVAGYCITLSVSVQGGGLVAGTTYRARLQAGKKLIISAEI